MPLTEIFPNGPASKLAGVCTDSGPVKAVPLRLEPRTDPTEYPVHCTRKPAPGKAKTHIQMFVIASVLLPNFLHREDWKRYGQPCSTLPHSRFQAQKKRPEAPTVVVQL